MAGLLSFWCSTPTLGANFRGDGLCQTANNDPASWRGHLRFSDELMPIDLAVRDWARRDPAAAEHLRRVDNFRIGYLRSLLAPVCPDEDELEADA
jgi:hypothetical protein